MQGEWREMTVIGCDKIETSDIYRLGIKPLNGHMFIAPGQFLFLKSRCPESTANRPFSVIYTLGDTVCILFRKVGKNTELYSQLKRGEHIWVKGPMGQAFPLDINDKKQKYIFVAGGIGMAPLCYLALNLPLINKESLRNIVFLYGAGDERRLVLKKELAGICRELETIIDDKGFVTDLLAERLQSDNGKSVVVACGPWKMLEKTALLCAKFGNKCFVNVERFMTCSGTESCLSCAVFCKTNGQCCVKHACVDGPVLDAGVVDWKANRPPTGVSIIKEVAPAMAKEIDMSTVLRGNGKELRLKSPLAIPSGCLGHRAALDNEVDLTHAGMVITKGTSVLPRLGNPGPRICEVDYGLLNAIGIESTGIEDMCKRILSELERLALPIFVNLYGQTIKEFAELAKWIEDTCAAGIEINVSCPNTEAGGMAFGISPTEVWKITNAVVKVSSKFIIVKHTPEAGYAIPDVIKASFEAGANGATLLNTIKGMAIDVGTGQPKLASVFGGQSGPGNHPSVLRQVFKAHFIHHDMAIIGCGGIHDRESAAVMAMAGASALMSGTASFNDPDILNKLHRGLIEVIVHHGLDSYSKLVGLTHRVT